MDRKVYEFISKQTSDPIVEWKTCRVSGKEFAIFQSDLDFLDKIAYNFTLKGEVVKIPIPTPTLCPEERQRRRLMFRNERKLYRRKCDLTGKNIISIYSPESPYKVYDQKVWWSDKRDALQYGRDFDFGKPFFQQFDELMKEVPQMAVINFNNQNSEYNNYLNDSKNCYMCSGSGYLEDSYFCNWTYEGKNLVDCGYCFRGENSYMNVACESFYKSYFSIESKSVSDCYYCFDCENCRNCVGCVGLRGKDYCVFNEQYSKEKYSELFHSLPIGKDNDYFIKNILQLKNNYGHANQRITGSENCFGNDIKNSKNALFSFEIDKGENVKYSRELLGMKNVQDVNNHGWSELEYEIMGFGYNYNVHFTLYSATSKSLYYCAYCQNCENCFGCVSLHNKKFCIFNKQYSEEEYKLLVLKIISHMNETQERGEFFPISLSPFAYNESVVQDFMSLSREEALARGYKWQDKNYDPVIPENVKVLKGDEIRKIAEGLQTPLAPSSPSPLIRVDLDETINQILKSILICEVSGRPFRIIKQELDFYRKHNLPIPTKHPDVRHQERLAKRPGRELYFRKCDKCGVEMLSVYGGMEGLRDGGMKVFCEVCYNHEIYG